MSGGTGGWWGGQLCLQVCVYALIYLSSTCSLVCCLCVPITADAFLRPCLWEALPELCVCGRCLRPSLMVHLRPPQVLWAAPAADRGGGAGAERADAACPPGGAAERALSLRPGVPSRGPRHLPPALQARAGALPQRPAGGAPSAGRAGGEEKAVGKGEQRDPKAQWRGVVGVVVEESVAKGRERGRVMGRDRDSAEGEGAVKNSGLGESSPQLFRTPPERAIHRCHQLPVPALRLSCHHDTQALPPARATRRRPHQPNPAPAGQGVAAGRDAQLDAEQGSLSLRCVPNWLQEVLVTRPLILSRSTALHSLQSISTVTQSHE